MANMLMMRYAAQKGNGTEGAHYTDHDYRDGDHDSRMRRHEDHSHERYTRNAEDYKKGRWERRDDDDWGDDVDDKITREKAEKWVSHMTGSDPAHPDGGRWKMDEVKPFAQKYGFPTNGSEFYEFFLVMNAMYSDYYEVAKKFGVNNPDFFAELAKAFIHDKDANPGKVEMYFKHIAKK